MLVGRDLGKMQKVVEELGDVAPRDELVEDLRHASVEIGKALIRLGSELS